MFGSTAPRAWRVPVVCWCVSREDSHVARSAVVLVTLKEAGGLGNWLNAGLFPYLGPPPLGSVETATPDERAQAALAHACPLCGAQMSAHTVDRSAPLTQLYFPEH